ncbi:hypothetical protein D3C86_1694230 [compost metagenome]
MRRPVRHAAGEQQPAAQAEVDQTAQARALLLRQPLQHQRWRLDEHHAVADAIGQAQQQQALVILGETLGQGQQGIQQQRQGQGDAHPLRRVQGQPEQRAEQVADVIPGRQARALFQAEQTVVDQVRQQRGEGETTEPMHYHQRTGARQQGEEDVARLDCSHG